MSEFVGGPTWDGQLVPTGGGRAERQEPRTRLAERLEGAILSRLHYLDDPGPTGSRGLGLELDSGCKLIIMAARDLNSRYRARLIFRWIEPVIITPRMDRIFARGRDADPAAGPPDDLQRRVEGQVIRGIIQSTQLSRNGGEQCALEFADGGVLALAASPRRSRTERGEPLIADVSWVYAQRPRIVMP